MRLIENNWGRVRCPKCDSVMDQITKEDIRDSDDGHYIIKPSCEKYKVFSFVYETGHLLIF